MNYRTYGTLIWENKSIHLQINEWQSRYFLVDSETGEKLNEMVTGAEGLKRYYKGEFLRWVKVIMVKTHKARLKEHEYHLKHAAKQLALADYYEKILVKLGQTK